MVISNWGTLEGAQQLALRKGNGDHAKSQEIMAKWKTDGRISGTGLGKFAGTTTDRLQLAGLLANHPSVRQ